MAFVHKEHGQIGTGGKVLNGSLTSPVVQDENSHILKAFGVVRETAKKKKKKTAKKKKTVAADMKIQEWAEEEEDIEKKKMAEADIEKKKKMEEWLEGNIEMKKKIEEWAAKKKKKTAKKKKAAKKKKKKTAKKKKKIQEWAEEEDLEKKKKIQEWDIEKKKMEEWLEGNIEMNKNIEEWAWAEEEDLEMKKMKKKILEWAAEVREVPWKDQDQDSEQGWSEDLGLNIGQPPTPQSRSESSVDFEDLEYFIKMYEPKVEPEEYL